MVEERLEAASFKDLQALERPQLRGGVIGLYVDPPVKALVLCFDEKSQCQALERTQPGLPPAPSEIDRETPRPLDLHLVADNYATHKHPMVRAWLEKNPRFKLQFTPTSSSWLNLVERFFADLTGDVIRAGSFTSVNDLVRDIKAISLSVTPIRSHMFGEPKVPRSSPKSNAHEPRSQKLPPCKFYSAVES